MSEACTKSGPVLGDVFAPTTVRNERSEGVLNTSNSVKSITCVFGVVWVGRGG